MNRKDTMIIFKMRSHCKTLAVIFRMNRIICDSICNYHWNLCKIQLEKKLCTAQTISPDKEEEYNVQHKQTMADYKKSFEHLDQKTRLRNYMYISHRDAADLAVTSYLQSEITKDELVLEINPGFGILTRALLEAGVPQIRVYEDKPVFLQHLSKLSESYPGCMEIMKEDFLYMPFGMSEKRDKFDRLLKGITSRKWKDAPTKVFIALPTKTEKLFMKRLIYSIPNTRHIFKIGRVEFFMFLSGREFSVITAKPKTNYSRYLISTVWYSLLFDIQIFGEIERSHFFTPLRFVKSRTKHMFDNTNMYFVKLTPKADIFDNGMTSGKLFELIHFVQTCFRKRKRNVLPLLESYIPNCGPAFIKNGITMGKKVGELSPQEFFEIFKIFSSLPEYEMFTIKNEITSSYGLYESDFSESKTSTTDKE